MSDSVTEVMEPVPGEPPKKPKGDLGIRTLSAIVMVAVAAGAYWAGGLVFQLFILAIALGLLWEYYGLVRLLSKSRIEGMVWLAFGVIYIGLAAFMIMVLNSPFYGGMPILMIVGSVIATDVGAYFAGRTFGGPKIAPKISPSKTWSGLIGGMICSAAFFVGFHHFMRQADVEQWWPVLAVTGAVLAVTAQAGDFFESWMKRRAGVKDSGKLIPGHGGLLDRTDGLIAVLFVTGLIFFSTAAFA